MIFDNRRAMLLTALMGMQFLQVSCIYSPLSNSKYITLQTTASSILQLNFSNLASSSTIITKGCYLRLRCLISGLVSGTQSENVYEGIFYVLPGTTAGAPCSKFTVQESTMVTMGNALTVASSISGTGTIANITLTSSQAISNQSTLMLHEITSDNLISVS